MKTARIASSEETVVANAADGTVAVVVVVVPVFAGNWIAQVDSGPLYCEAMMFCEFVASSPPIASWFGNEFSTAPTQMKVTPYLG